MPSSESPLSAPPSQSTDAASEKATEAKSTHQASLTNVAVSLLLSVFVLGIIAYLTFDASAFRSMVGQVQPVILVGAVGVAFARIGLGGARLSYVSRGRLSLRGGTRGQLAWDFFSSVTPSVVGGGPIAAFYVARDQNITVGESAAFMFFCILLDQLWFVAAIPVLIIGNVYIDLLPEAAGAVGLWSLMAYFAGLLVWAALYAYATLVRPRLLLGIVHWCLKWPYLRRARTRVMQEMRSYVRRARTLGTQSPSFYVNGFLLTGLNWMARYGLVVLIVQSVYVNVDTLTLFLRSAAMMLVGLIMPTPGGSGGIEGLYALFVGPLIPASLVAPTLLTWRLLGYYLFIAFGAYLFMHQLQNNSPSETTSSSDGSPPSS